MGTLTCKHKICEKKVVHWSPDFIPLRVFNDLEPCSPYKLISNLSFDKFLKKFIEWFPNNYHICRCRPNYFQKWQQEHLTARSSNPFFSQSVMAIPINFVYTILNGIKLLRDETTFPKCVVFFRYYPIISIVCFLLYLQPSKLHPKKFR